ncbi:hypothetical protein ACIRPH_30800 [Nocardiopsis sp. NPDC101807]|uniref:hypothetical protein n=1 Tax=Nocardiopsis sp. NPDC101807 TaxID=3364339 RepID=UPI0037FB15D8
MYSPDDPLIPFQVQVANLGDSALTSLAETADGLTWSIQDGAPVSLTAVEAVHELPDLPLLTLCIAFGIYAPLDAIRSDPAGLLGELAKMLATPEIIPECLRGPARHRA